MKRSPAFAKTLLFLILLACLAAFTACGSGSGDTGATTVPADLDVKEAVTPPADFILDGEWQDKVSQRATMNITPGEGNEAYDVEILWASSAEETTVWTFSGTFDPVGGFLYYQDGRKATVTTDDEATGEEKVEYEGGTGTISYFDGVLLWQDDKEDAGADCQFVKP